MKASLFHQLHHADAPLVLPNAWDAGSARLMESVGAKAVATTSAGVAWSHGYRDGDLLPRPLLLQTLRNVVRAVNVPVTADIEGGYSNDPAAVAALVKEVVETGVVGINIEDAGNPVELLIAKIEAIRAVAPDLYINARTDVYLFELVTPDQRVAETLRRGALYKAAGASGLFVPAIANAAEIRMVTEAVGLPVNVLAWPGLPPLAELAGLGVKRLSAGSSIYTSLLARAAGDAAAFLSHGSTESATPQTLAYADINALMPI